MSDFLAVARVTETLRQLLDAAISADVPGATATTSRPGPSGPSTGLPDVGVNVFLYQVTPDAAARNADLPTRRSDSSLAEPPTAALDLHYLLTFHGKESGLEPQRVLGSVVRTLHAQPVLTGTMIKKAVKSVDFLGTADLVRDVERVRFAPSLLTLEELSRLWSVFFQSPYSLSAAYQASVVLIEGRQPPRPALPVQRRELFVAPFREPIVQRVTPQAGAGAPILTGSTLLVEGERLRADRTLVQIGSLNVTPSPEDVTDQRIRVALPTVGLHAGVRGLQVVQQALLPSAAEALPVAESNVVAFVLRPRVTSASVSGTTLTLVVQPRVGRDQRLSVLLNQRASTTPVELVLMVADREADTDTITVSLPSGTASGAYFVRVRVDGAESPLDLDPASPTFGPTVTLP